MRIPSQLTFQFFEYFARFECALKETGFCRKGRWGEAQPNWQKFEDALAAEPMSGSSPLIAEAFDYLLHNPPQIQVFSNNRAVFKPKELSGKTDAARVCDALRRVRNNLFHGGKHTDHSPEERDAKLLRYGLIVLDAAAELDPNLRAVYRGEY